MYKQYQNIVAVIQIILNDTKKKEMPSYSIHWFFL